jgi:hypothetical protein
MNIPSALLDCLSANKIDYEILPHAEAFTARMAAAAEDIARHRQAKVVMVQVHSSAEERNGKTEG